MAIIDSMLTYWRFAWGLRKFLKEPITLEQSLQIIRQRLENRENNLLAIAKKAIYEHEASPYLKLLRMIGCEYGDFEKMVRSEGVESSLKKIADEGVFISIEEFKGKKDAIRGGQVFRFKERDFDNPYLAGHLQASSGASRSAGTRTVFDFNYMTEIITAYNIPILNALDALDLPFALWMPIMPGPGPITVLTHTKGGITPVKWFSPVERSGFKPSLRSRMATNYIVYMGRIFGAKLPKPEYIPLDEAWKVAQWMADIVKTRGGCCLNTYTSAAVRICQAAREKGLDIAGAMFMVCGEPITEIKRKEIESTTGVTLCPVYGSTEAGAVGEGCFNSVAADDVHLLKDSFALIQKPREVPHAGVSVDAFLFTTLSQLAPKILLNEETGDYGVVETRRCGCKLEELGFTDHIHNIRGFDKLTGEGMTFIGTDLVNIIEKVLPAKFGGFSTDYQMVEEEDEKGHTRMSVIVSPEMGDLDEAEIIQTIIAELGKGSDAQRMMSKVWSQAKILRVKRMRPIATARGKLLPLHIRKSK
jgi:hypothetical protein